MKIEIDFSEITELESMHILLKEKLGFPDFYGKNLNALIDCLSSVRYPNDEMMNVSVDKDNMLSLVIKSFPLEDNILLNHFFTAIQSVNKRYVTRNESPPIGLIIT